MATSARTSDSNAIKAAHLYVGGLKSKIDQIGDVVIEHQIQVLAISGTHLDKKVKDEEVKLKGFKVFRKDRNSRGGGVALYIHKYIKPTIYTKELDCDIIWVMVSPPQSGTLLVGCCYKQHGKTTFVEIIREQIQNLKENGQHFLLMGNFNIDWLSKSNLKKEMEKLTTEFGLTQLVKRLTRKTKGTATIIDQIYTNIPRRCSEVTCTDVGFSDHRLLTVSVKAYNKCRKYRIKAALLNINGLKNKTDEIGKFVGDDKIQVLAISETHLDDKVNDEEVELDGFKLFRKDKDRNAGGVALYIQKDIEIMNTYEKAPNCEMIWAMVSLSKNKRLLVGCYYKPHKDKEGVKEMLKQIKNLKEKREDVLLMGDFNINWLSKSPQKKKIEKVTTECGLTQMVKCPTRVTKGKATCTDHIYTDIPDQCSKVTHTEVDSIDSIDHFLLTLSVKTSAADQPEVDDLTEDFAGINVNAE